MRKRYRQMLCLGVAASLLLSGCGSNMGEKKESASETSAAVESSVKVGDLGSVPIKYPGEWIEGEGGVRWWKGQATFYDAFDTVIDLTLYAKDEEAFQKAFAAAQEEFLRLHRLYDRYHAYSGVNNIYTINEQAGKGAVPVEEDLFSLLVFAKEKAPLANGKVNIAMGSVLELWHEAREAAGVFENGVASGNAVTSTENRDGTVTIEEREHNLSEEAHDHDHDHEHEHGHDHDASSASEKEFVAKLPDSAALEEAAKHTRLDDVQLDEANRTVFLKDPAMSLDVGAVAKGYATEIVARTLEAQGVHGIINAGGNVRTIGAPIDGRTEWTVGVQDPDTSRSEPYAYLKVGANQSVVTSGDYQRYFIVDGKKYHHIIDPATRFPGTLYRSVTVVTEDSGLADFLSTALFLSTEAEAKEIVGRFPDESVNILWILSDRSALQTDGLQRTK